MYAKGTCRQGKARPRWPRGTFVPALFPVLASALVAASMTLGGALAAVTDAAARVEVQILARAADSHGGEAFRLRDGGVLRTGDGVQLRISSEESAYVYVIAYGSSHTAILLHPFSGRAEDARVEPGAARIIPGADVFLPLDGQEGNETLFSIVSDTPLEDVSALLARIESHGDDLGAITALLNERHDGVRRLTFRHIGVRPLVGLAAVAPRRARTGQPSDAAGTRAPRPGGDAPAAADGGWTLPSPDASFGSGAPPAGAAAPGEAVVASVPAPVPTSRDAGAGESVFERPAPAVDASEDVSPALRRAREAAGIDEARFRGILATLPASGAADLSRLTGKRHQETGVLSAEGSRIRALDGAQVDSGEGLAAPAGSAVESTQ